MPHFSVVHFPDILSNTGAGTSFAILKCLKFWYYYGKSIYALLTIDEKMNTLSTSDSTKILLPITIELILLPIITKLWKIK